MTAHDPFEDYEHIYGDAVDESISFSHQGHDFFTRVKVRHLVGLMAHRLGSPQHRHVLDVGCGPGITDGHLTPHVGQLSGVDVSQPLLISARRDNPTVDYRHYDGHTLPWDNDHFDVSFTICVLHHVDPAGLQHFTDEMARVTRPGGLVVIFEHNPWNPLTRRAVNDCDFDQGVTLLSRPTTRDLCTNSGLRVVKSSFILFIPVNEQVSDLADRALGWLPLGGQYLIAATPAASPPP